MFDQRYAMSASGPDDTWALGVFNTIRGDIHLYLHWDGGRWGLVRPIQQPNW